MEEQWNYEDRREEGENSRLKPIHGILLIIVVMVSFYTIIAWAQMKWGMYGLALDRTVSSGFGSGRRKAFKSPLTLR